MKTERSKKEKKQHTQHARRHNTHRITTIAHRTNSERRERSRAKRYSILYARKYHVRRRRFKRLSFTFRYWYLLVCFVWMYERGCSLVSLHFSPCAFLCICVCVCVCICVILSLWSAQIEVFHISKRLYDESMLHKGERRQQKRNPPQNSNFPHFQ